MGENGPKSPEIVRKSRKKINQNHEDRKKLPKKFGGSVFLHTFATENGFIHCGRRFAESEDDHEV